MANAATLGGHVTVEDWAMGAPCARSIIRSHRARLRRRPHNHHAGCPAVLEDLRERNTHAFG